MTKPKDIVKHAFWDSSALVPLCCKQSASSKARQAARHYGRFVVWWISPIEILSAFQRLLREKEMNSHECNQAIGRLSELRCRWSEIQPGEELREQAERLLRVHRLRAADSLQLAAALVWCKNYPRNHTFVVSDLLLAEAADLEGFAVLRV